MSARNDDLTPYGKALLNYGAALMRDHAEALGVCRVCSRSLPKSVLRANSGACPEHRDEPTHSRKGCGECLHPTGHYNDCSRADP